MGMIRVQVLLSPEEKALLQREASRAGTSLSGWLREAALDRVAAARERFDSAAQLRALFAEDEERGSEPDWEQHLEVIGRSRRSGATDT